MKKCTLKEIKSEKTLINQKKSTFQKFRKESILFKKKKWIEENRLNFIKICDSLGIGEIKFVLARKVEEILDPLYSYIMNCFYLYERNLELLDQHLDLRNELVKALTLYWYSKSDISGDFSRIFSNPEFLEMFLMFKEIK